MVRWLRLYGITSLCLIVLWAFQNWPAFRRIFPTPVERLVRIQSNDYVLVLAVLLCLLLAWQCLHWMKAAGNVSASQWLSGGSLLGLFLLTVLPVGMIWRHYNFFYDHWIWFSLAWMIAGSVVLSIAPVWLRVCSKPSFKPVSPFHGVLGWFKQPDFQPWDALFVITATSGAGLAALVINQWVLGGQPHVQDSIVQVFQAKIFLHVAWSAPAPQHPEFFDLTFMISDQGRWFSIYPPGHALLLAAGRWLLSADVVNPFCAAASVAVLYWLAARLYNAPIARLATLLWALSPFHLFMAAGYMNHAANLLFVLLYFAALTEWMHRTRPGRDWFAFLAGLTLAVALMIRPFSALCLFLASLICLPDWLKRPHRIRFVFLFALAALGPLLLNAAYHHATTGIWYRSGYMQYFGGIPLGFGERPWGTEPLAHGVPNRVHHSPLRGLGNTLTNLTGLQYNLFGWPVPSLTFAVMLFWPGFRRTRTDWQMLLLALSLSIAYFFYFFQDFCYGPRFLFEAAPFWVLLTGRGIGTLINRLTHEGGWPKEAAYRFMATMLAAFWVISLCTSWVFMVKDFGDAYWGIDARFAHELRQRLDGQNAIVFVETNDDFLAVFPYNDPWLEQGTLFARDLGAQNNQRLLQAYDGRAAFRVPNQKIELGGQDPPLLMPLKEP